MGKENVFQLSKHGPGMIYLGARNASKAQSAIAEIEEAVPNAKLTYLEMDLTSFASIKKAADTFNNASQRLDILVNNAGIMACPPGVTQEGYEVQFGTNHMGHALLTKLLLPALERTAKEPGSDVRIINLSSEAHKWGPKAGLVLEDVCSNMGRYSTWSRYGQSKLANVFYTQQLARHYPSIKSIAVHPGSVDTGLSGGVMKSYPWFAWAVKPLSKIVCVNVAQGTLNQLWAATSKEAVSGHFYYPVAKDFPGSAQVQDEALSKKLWDWTETELSKHGY